MPCSYAAAAAATLPGSIVSAWPLVRSRGAAAFTLTMLNRADQVEGMYPVIACVPPSNSRSGRGCS